jgi:hypothetical protein
MRLSQTLVNKGFGRWAVWRRSMIVLVSGVVA